MASKLNSSTSFVVFVWLPCFCDFLRLVLFYFSFFTVCRDNMLIQELAHLSFMLTRLLRLQMAFFDKIFLRLVTVAELNIFILKGFAILLVAVASWGLWFSVIVFYWLNVCLICSWIFYGEIIIRIAFLEDLRWDHWDICVYIRCVWLAFRDDGINLFLLFYSFFVSDNNLILMFSNNSCMQTI